MNSDFFQGFLLARGVKLPTDIQDPMRRDDAIAEAIRQHVADLDAQINDLKIKLQAANDKLSQAGQSKVVVENSATMSQPEATALFNAAVREAEGTCRMGFQEAWDHVKCTRPALHAAMRGPQAAPALANSLPPVPGRSPQILAALGLPAEANDAEFQAAWTGTKGVVTPRDSAGIWRMLAARISGATGLSGIGLEWQMSARYPALAAELGKAQKPQPSGA